MIKRWHITSLLGMGCGLVLVIQPLWDQGLKVGFFVTLVSTILYIVSGHMKKNGE